MFLKRPWAIFLRRSLPNQGPGTKSIIETRNVEKPTFTILVEAPSEHHRRNKADTMDSQAILPPVRQGPPSDIYKCHQIIEGLRLLILSKDEEMR